MLEFVDVRIMPQRKIDRIEINTSNRAYALTRSCLLFLKDEVGLPVSLYSETMAAQGLHLRKDKNSSGTLPLTDGGDLPIRYANNFLLAVWEINVRGDAALNALSEDVAARLRQFGLNCKVFPIF